MYEKYYLVEVMCGHVGAYAYIPVIFPIAAENGREAAKIARNIPRVKHHNKYAILSVKKASYEEYLAQVEANEEDAYLNWRDTGSTEDYYASILDRIKYMDGNPYVSKRKKERSKRPDSEYRGCRTFRLNLCEC